MAVPGGRGGEGMEGEPPELGAGLYAALNLPRDAPQEQVKRAFRDLAKVRARGPTPRPRPRPPKRPAAAGTPAALPLAGGA